MLKVITHRVLNSTNRSNDISRTTIRADQGVKNSYITAIVELRSKVMETLRGQHQICHTAAEQVEQIPVGPMCPLTPFNRARAMVHKATISKS